MSHLLQLFSQSTDTLAGPSQAGFRVTPRRGLHQFFQVRHQTWILLFHLLPPASWTANPTNWTRRWLLQLLQPLPDYLTGHARRLRHRRDAAPSPCLTFSSSDQASRLLV